MFEKGGRVTGKGVLWVDLCLIDVILSSAFDTPTQAHRSLRLYFYPPSEPPFLPAVTQAVCMVGLFSCAWFWLGVCVSIHKINLQNCNAGSIEIVPKKKKKICRGCRIAFLPSAVLQEENT